MFPTRYAYELQTYWYLVCVALLGTYLVFGDERYAVGPSRLFIVCGLIMLRVFPRDGMEKGSRTFSA